jgi:cobaltochelatase CobS
MLTMQRLENVKALKVADVEAAYDILSAKLAEAGESQAVIQERATEMLKDVLVANDWSNAGHVTAFVKSHDAGKLRGKKKAATPETASALALELAAAAFGGEIAFANDAADTAAVPSDASETGSTETMADAATDTNLESTPTVAGVKPGSAAGKAADKVNKPAKADAASPQAVIPEEVAKIAAADDRSLAAIGATLASLTNNKLTSAEGLVAAFNAAQSFLDSTAAATGAAKVRLALHQQGEHEKAGEVEVPQVPAFKPSGFAQIKIDDSQSIVLDTLLGNAANKPGLGFSDLVQALAKAEKACAKAAEQHRALQREIRKAAPKTTIRIEGGTTGEDLPPHDIVMKPAIEVFKKASYGNASEILEFEVPTIEWYGEKHPEVPEIDPTFRFRRDILASTLDCIADNKIPMIFGESGSGKSEFCEQVAAHLGLPFFRMNLDIGITRLDVTGRTVLRPGAGNTPITEFMEGLVPRALQLPSILLLDEFDCADPELMPVLQPVLEGRGLRILEEGGRYVRPHPLSRILITGNSNGHGSPDGAYNTVQELSAATRNRIAQYLKMGYLPESEEIKVVLERHPSADPDFVKKVIQLANLTRQGREQGKIAHVLSTRNVLEAARKHAKFAPLLKSGDERVVRDWVLETTILDGAEEGDRAILKQTIDQVFA